jgi:hypothetical protein
MPPIDLPALTHLLDGASRALTLVLAVGALVGFLLRRWIGAWIDAAFKRKIEAELDRQRHNLALQLERERATLISEVQHKKAELDRSNEGHRRKEDRNADLAERISTRRLEAYEAFHTGFGDMMRDLHALRYLDDTEPPIDKAARETLRLRYFANLQLALAGVSAHDLYIDPDLKVRIATLYRDMSGYLSSGATDRVKLDQIATAESEISASMQLEFIHPSRGAV